MNIEITDEYAKSLERKIEENINNSTNSTNYSGIKVLENEYAKVMLNGIFNFRVGIAATSFNADITIMERGTEDRKVRVGVSIFHKTNLVVLKEVKS